MAKKVRKANGQFDEGGGPGRPLGMPNQTTIDGRVLRGLIWDSWSKVGGVEKLVEFATANDANYATYLRLMTAIMPKELDANITSSLDVIRKVAELERDPSAHVAPKTISFLMQCQERAGKGGVVTPDVVTQQLEADLVGGNGKGTELHGIGDG